MREQRCRIWMETQRGWSGWEGRSLRAEGQPKGIVVGTQAAG